jgi:polyhydroxyalkanoate synthase subunit PhaC
MPVQRREVVVMATEGTSKLYHFSRPADPERHIDVAPHPVPLLLIPSLINRWYVLDLRPGASFAAALVDAGIDTWCLDWGIPEDEDRYLTWEDIQARLGRAVRRVRRFTGADKVGILGYCMGATVSGIWTARHPDQVAAFINLAGPFDFAAGGMLAEMVHPQHFDAGAVADAGNVNPVQMQSGFSALRPTLDLAKWVGFIDRAHDPAARTAFRALETWASDNIPFPGEAYRTYIQELYQANGLVNRTHRVRGKTVDLAAIRCPVLSITAQRDNICPPDAATALNRMVSSRETKVLTVPGGHVGAVIGSRAARELYPATAQWYRVQTGTGKPSRSKTDEAQ